jgi:hypothetical protein
MTMNEARFMALLGAYGADLARWPEDDRAHAEVFLDGAPHRIKDVWESERSFDHLLALERDVPSSIALETAVIDAAPGRRAIRRSLGQIRWPAMPKWATGGAIAASLALGLAVGYASEPEASPEQDYASMLTVSGGGGGSMFLSAMNDVED